MNSSVLILCVLMWSLWSTVCETPASSRACSLLRRQHPTEELEVLVNGQAVQPVVWGGGGGPRAAAALLQAVLLARGYRPRLQTTSPYLCQLVNLPYITKAAVVAPAAIVSDEGCGNQANVQLLSNFVKPARVLYGLRLWAHVPRPRCRSRAGLWTFYKHYEEVNECGFIESKLIRPNSTGTCDKCFAVLVRNESFNDKEVAIELQSRLDPWNLLLQIVYFESDFIMRKTIFKLKMLQTSFLFLDEDLWSDTLEVVEVQPPPCAKNVTVCPPSLNSVVNFPVGNGWFMNQFASPIQKIVNEFSPKSSQLNEILHIESEQTASDIEDAACSWALRHEQQFKTFMTNISQEKRRVFAIEIILCKDDPRNKYFENITKLINRQEFQNNITKIDYNIYKKNINCLDEEEFRNTIPDITRQRANLAGVVAWSWYAGTVGVAKVAEQYQLPLLLAGALADEVPLGPAVHAASGHLSDLTRAFHYLLEVCEWSRIAILSDNSVYSKSFTETLIKQNNLIYREIIVNTKNIFVHLEEFVKADARILLLNVNWSLSNDILLAALKKGMTPKNGFQWITREWRPIEPNDSTDWADMYHITVSLGWRGEEVQGGSKSLQNKFRKLLHVNESLGEVTGDGHLSMFADALLQLGYGFAQFHQKYPSYTYNLRGVGSASKFSEVLQNMTITGITQDLRNKDFTLQEPLVFFNKWYGTRAKSIGIFRITQNNLVPVTPTVSNYKRVFNSQRLRDGPACWSVSTGAPFTPRCQDVTILVVTVLLLLSGLSLYIAQRARMRRLLKREFNIVASLLDIRNLTLSRLNAYLVDRNAIKLLHVIGSGTFGRVHFAELQRSGRGILVVAAKEPRQDIGPTEECEFLREAYILAPLCHNNIIRLVGICVVNGPPMVLMEHAFYLDLKRYLTERRHLVCNRFDDINRDVSDEVADESLTRLAREAAGALAYLSSRRLVHRDIRAANCLIDKNRSLKLGDFGMARELDAKAPEYATIRRALFPVLWMAPESLKLGLFSFATDIWALGVLILEVVTFGARPYGDWQPSRVLHYVTAGGFPPLPPDVSRHTSSLLHSCWERRAEDRPSASWVEKYLTQKPRALSPALLKPYPPDPLSVLIE